MVQIANFLPGIVLALIALIELGFFLFFWRYEKTITIKAYLGFIAGVILWVGSNSIAYLHGDGDISFILRFAYFGGTLVASSFIVFIHAFPHPRSRYIHVLKYFPFVACAVFGILLFGTQTFYRVFELHNGVMSNVTYGISAKIWSVFFVATWIFGLVELLRRHRRSEGFERRRFRYLMIGVVFSLIIGVTTDVVLPLFNLIHYGWFGPGMSVVWLWFSVKAVRVTS
ncbi:MAG: histidine kinase N-terminal 7TM domain-containing protein [Parcubacteria group bacterium]